MINTVVDIVKNLAVSPGFTHDFRNQYGCRCHDEPSRFGNDLDIAWKQPRTLRIDDGGQLLKFRDLGIIRDGEAAADVDNIEMIPPFSWPRGKFRM